MAVRLQPMTDPNASVLALDVGTKRIGVAVANLGVRFASPLTTLDRPKTFLQDIAQLCREESAAILVLGLPRGLEGQETEQTAWVRNFGRELGEYLGGRGMELPLYWIDEALTSAKAEHELQSRRGGRAAYGRATYSRADIDSLAATYMLEDFLREFYE